MNLEMLRQSYEVVGYDLKEGGIYKGGIQAIRTISDAVVLESVLNDLCMCDTYYTVLNYLKEYNINSICFIETFEVVEGFRLQGYGTELLNTLMNEVPVDAYIIIPEFDSLYAWCETVGFESIDNTDVLIYVTNPEVELALQEEMKIMNNK